MISWRERVTRSYDALITSCKYCLFDLALLPVSSSDARRVARFHPCPWSLDLIKDPLGRVVEQRQEWLRPSLSG